MRYEVVGVVRDLRNAPLGQSVEPAIYLTTRQFPFRELTLAVRASDRSVAVAAVRAALKDVAPSVPMAAAQSWGERFAALTAEPRLLMTLLVFFGVLAALLAALGVYGLLSWSVALRSCRGSPPLIQFDALELLGDDRVDRLYILFVRLPKDTPPAAWGRTLVSLPIQMRGQRLRDELLEALAAQGGTGLGTTEEVSGNLQGRLHHPIFPYLGSSSIGPPCLLIWPACSSRSRRATSARSCWRAPRC